MAAEEESMFDLEQTLQFQRCLEKAPTKVQGLLRLLKVASFEKARAVSEKDLAALQGYGKRTLGALAEWLQDCGEGACGMEEPAVEGTEALDKGNTGVAETLPDVSRERFLSKLAEAPRMVQDVLETLGIADWEAFRLLDIENDPKLLSVRGIGKQKREILAKWRAGVARPNEWAHFRDYPGFGAWLDAVVAEIPGMGRREAQEQFTLFKRRTGLDSETEDIPTLEEVALMKGITRQRMLQIEDIFLTGGKGRTFRGLKANREAFGDFVRLMDEIFGEETVLGQDEFERRLEKESPWDEEWGVRAMRLARILNDVTRKPVEGFATWRAEEQEEKRYDAFKAVVAGRSRDNLGFESLRGAMEGLGAVGMTETEYLYFRERGLMEPDTERLFKQKFGPESRYDRSRRAIIEVLTPAGQTGLTMEEFQTGLERAMPGEAPQARGFLNSADGLGRDGGAPFLWIPCLGGGDGRVSRYALSTFWTPLSMANAQVMEMEMAEHLRKHGCTAGSVSMFWKRWKDDGTIAADVCSDRVLLGLLKQAKTGILQYPACHSSPVYALPGAKIPRTGVFRDQALLYFKGRDVGSEELLTFAMEVYGYVGEMVARNEIMRQFPAVRGG